MQPSNLTALRVNLDFISLLLRLLLLIRFSDPCLTWKCSDCLNEFLMSWINIESSVPERNSVFPIKLINKSSGKVDEKNPFYFHFSPTLIEKSRRWGERKQATARCNWQSNTNKRVTESKERGEEKNSLNFHFVKHKANSHIDRPSKRLFPDAFYAKCDRRLHSPSRYDSCASNTIICDVNHSASKMET